ncbi:MAG: hypothetical protein R3C02_20515 [Planctomycetaceae bacterium]
MIEVAAVLSVTLVRHWDDFAIILMLLVMNAIVGFWEEFQVGNAINWYGVSHVVDMSDSSHASWPILCTAHRRAMPTCT